MNKSKQIFSVLLAATFLSPLAPVTSFAREKITQVSLSFSMDPDSWENLNVDCEDESYFVRTVNLFPDGSATSSFPYAVIVLDAEDDYYLPALSRNILNWKAKEPFSRKPPGATAILP